MTKYALIAILSIIVSSSAYAQMQCQVMSNGVVFCTPAGGGFSPYGR